MTSLDVDEGDWRVPTLTVTPVDGTPADGTTLATLVIVRPDDTTFGLAPTTSDIGTTWTAPGYELTAAGEWIERWTVTGKGAGKERFVLRVAPDPAAAPNGSRVYATTIDYALWLRAAPPAGARRALAAASRAVEEMTLTARYDVDTNLMPTDAAVLAAMRDATCAQAAHARANGDPYGTGAARLQSATIGKISVTRVAPAAGRHSPEAWWILHDAGLVGRPSWT